MNFIRLLARAPCVFRRHSYYVIEKCASEMVLRFVGPLAILTIWTVVLLISHPLPFIGTLVHF